MDCATCMFVFLLLISILTTILAKFMRNKTRIMPLLCDDLKKMQYNIY